MKQHPRAHLLMGAYDREEKPPGKRPSHAALLKHLASAICRRGHYAVTALCNLEDGDFAIVAVERREDADRMTRAIKARIAPRFGSWRSHRSFNFDVKAYGRIAALLAAGLVSSKQQGKPAVSKAGLRRTGYLQSPKDRLANRLVKGRIAGTA